MSFKQHFLLMAGYNRRMNQQVYQSASNLSSQTLKENVGAFFGSIFGTLNHILVADLIWMSQFESHADHYSTLKLIHKYPKPKSLNDELFPELQELYEVRKELDDIILQWIDEISESDFERNLLYKNTKGVESSKNFGELMFHFF